MGLGEILLGALITVLTAIEERRSAPGKMHEI
jgi:hypothetical protein